ncbi:MAG: PASTA domain-containing protein [Oscillospiraceae bacterium]|nr:PASTA domain-containing protein [Oscillospiraceae bacterium]
MAEHNPRRDQRRENASKQLIFRRTAVLMGLFGVLTFSVLGWKLWDVSITKHEEYQLRQLQQSTRDVEVKSNRGYIRDTGGNIMAMSATVYNLILSPRDLINSISERQFKQDDGTIDTAAREAAIQARRDLICDEVCTVLGLDRDDVVRRMNKVNSQYEVLKKNIEGDQADRLQAFIADNKLGYSLIMTPTTKRYYPMSTVAAHVVGFVNENGGAYGVEAAYEQLLEGRSGRIVTNQTGAGTEMYNSYSNYIDAEDGSSITLTLDSTIQRMAEQTLAAGIEKYDVQNGGICVVMDPKTCAVLAMASAPTYDLNAYGTIYDETLNARAAASKEQYYQQFKAENPTDEDGKPLTEEELRSKASSAAVSAALNQQWRNKVLNDTYEPGSTFKSVVLAAALEAGVISESDHFYCPGYYVVAGRTIHCSDRQGHGDQTLAEAVQNSCNPAFMMIGQRLGAEAFYDYFEAFGLKDATGIDLPGEATGLVWSRDYFVSPEGYQSLATASFGQRFTVSPLQLLSAFSATINGGYLMQPYLLKSVSDAEGNIVLQHEPTAIRQVISETTSRKTADILESVVSEGTGRNAYVAGYRIGGKTGTAEGEVGTQDEEIVSFVGFAPAEDPQVIVLLYFDTPKHASPGSKYGSTGYYISGGQMAAPMAGQLIAEILDYLGVERQYTQAEAAAADVSVPKLTGYDLTTAQAALKRKNLSCRTVGNGPVVTDQIPAVGATIPGNSTVILYMGQQAPTQQINVPNLRGLTYDQAKKRLNDLGLYMRASGVSYYSAVTKAVDQSIGAGELVDRGTVIPVRFVDTSVSDGYSPLE